VAEGPSSVTGDRQLQVAPPQWQLSGELVESTNWRLRPRADIHGPELAAPKRPLGSRWSRAGI